MDNSTPVNLFDVDNAPVTFTPEVQEPVTPPRKWNLGNSNDRNELYQLLKIKALVDNPNAIAKDVARKVRESIVQRNEQGVVSGTKHSLMTGLHATAKNQTDMFKALRADAYKRYGIKE